MMINLIVAVSENDAIGKDNKLLFHLKDDMKNFKRLTTGNVVVMGRKTYESIGKPLPDRINVIISRRVHENSENVKWVTSLEDAINTSKDNGVDIYIIGGGSIYREALEKDIVDRIYLTRVKKKVDDADTFFPKLDYDKKWMINKVNGYKEGMIEYDICEIQRR